MDRMKCFKYAAGVCYAVLAVISGYNMLTYGVAVWPLMATAGALIIALSCFTSLPLLMSAGGLLCLVRQGSWLLTEVMSGYRSRYRYAVDALLLIYWVLILIIGVKPKYTKLLGIAAAAVWAGGVLVDVRHGFIVHYFPVTVLGGIQYAVPFLGALLLALSAKDSRQSAE